MVQRDPGLENGLALAGGFAWLNWAGACSLAGRMTGWSGRRELWRADYVDVLLLRMQGGDGGMDRD